MSGLFFVLGAISCGSTADAVAPTTGGCLMATQPLKQALLRADNFYVAYIGSASGEGLRSVSTTLRRPARGWNVGEVESIDEAAEGDHLYVLAWDVGGPQMLIGQVTLPSGIVVATNTAEWESALLDMAQPAAMPAAADVEPLLRAAAWSAPAAHAANGAAPWGKLPAFGECAEFIWHDTLAASAPSDGKVVAFRTKQALR